MTVGNRFAFLHGFGTPGQTEPPAIALSVSGLDSPIISLGKGEAFDDWWNAEGRTKLTDGSLHITRSLNRAYVHYVLDCWLDGKPVQYSYPWELAEARL